MKKVNSILLCSMMLVGLVSFVGCSAGNTAQISNELQFSLDTISNITISYDEENITFIEGTGEQLIVKEYMTNNHKKYYAKVKEDKGKVHISEGKKPLFSSGFLRYVEVYLPANYQNSLTVTSTNGTIDFGNKIMKLSSFRSDTTSGQITIESGTADLIYLSTTSGSLNIGSLEGKEIRLDSTSGLITCKELIGSVDYTSTSGDINVTSATGSGSYVADNSGVLKVTYAQVSGDLFFKNKNDTMEVTLPKELAFHFEGTTKNGTITTSFGDSLTAKGDTLSGTVGNDSDITVKVETNNGNIVIQQN